MCHRFSFIFFLLSLIASDALLATEVASQPARLELNAEQRLALKPKVIFIGGYGATDTDMASWKRQAESVSKYSSEFKFESFAIAPRAWADTAVTAANAALIDKLVQEIDSSPPGAKFILSGHSSGSAVSNEVARRVREKSKIGLVVLDGFFPRNVSAEVKTHCWLAVDSQLGAVSRNAKGMSACARSHAVKTEGCKDSMCQHFTVVNRSAPRVGVNGGNYKQKGYQDLEPMLEWLDDFRSPAVQETARGPLQEAAAPFERRSVPNPNSRLAPRQ